MRLLATAQLLLFFASFFAIVVALSLKSSGRVYQKRTGARADADLQNVAMRFFVVMAALFLSAGIGRLPAPFSAFLLVPSIVANLWFITHVRTLTLSRPIATQSVWAISLENRWPGAIFDAWIVIASLFLPALIIIPAYL